MPARTVRDLIHDIRNIEFAAVMRLHLLAERRVALAGNGARLMESLAALHAERLRLAAAVRARRRP